MSRFTASKAKVFAISVKISESGRSTFKKSFLTALALTLLVAEDAIAPCSALADPLWGEAKKKTDSTAPLILQYRSGSFAQSFKASEL
jgi:hypothetical protein